MEQVELPADLMKLRRPQKTADLRISHRVEDQHLLGLHDPFQGICTADIQRLIVVRIVCRDIVIFSVPVHTARIRAIFRKGRLKMLLVHASAEQPAAVLPRRPLAIRIPVDPAFHHSAVTVRRSCPCLQQFLPARAHCAV